MQRLRRDRRSEPRAEVLAYLRHAPLSRGVMCVVQGWRSCLAYPWLPAVIPPGSCQSTEEIASHAEGQLFDQPLPIHLPSVVIGGHGIGMLFGIDERFFL